MYLIAPLDSVPSHLAMLTKERPLGGRIPVISKVVVAITATLVSAVRVAIRTAIIIP